MCDKFSLKLIYDDSLSLNMFIHHNLNPWDTAPTSTDNIPWYVMDDRTLVTHVKQAANGQEKSILSIAELICNMTRERGVTEVRMVDHTMSPKMQVRYFEQI